MSVPEAFVAIEGVAAECNVLRAVIRHGRDDPSSQPNADAATIQLVGPMPAGIEIGADLTLSARLDGVDYPRFAGQITDILLGWDSPSVPAGTIIAVGQLATMGRRSIAAGGAGGLPMQADGVRANAAIEQADVPTDAARTDTPGTVQLIGLVDHTPANPAPAMTCLQVAHDAARDGAGMLWQARDGVVLYADADHRHGALPVLELADCDLPLSLAWAVGLEGLCNDVTIKYGAQDDPPPGGVDPAGEVHDSDPASIAERGMYPDTLTTRLALAADAVRRADVVIARQSAPAWTLTGLRMALQSPGIGPALSAELMALEIHDLLRISGMPADAPATDALVFVEGWAETIEPAAWALDLALSDYCRTASPPQWDEVVPALTWDTADPALTWDGAHCVPPWLATIGEDQ